MADYFTCDHFALLNCWKGQTIARLNHRLGNKGNVTALRHCSAHRWEKLQGLWMFHSRPSQNSGWSGRFNEDVKPFLQRSHNHAYRHQERLARPQADACLV